MTFFSKSVINKEKISNLGGWPNHTWNIHKRSASTNKNIQIKACEQISDYAKLCKLISWQFFFYMKMMMKCHFLSVSRAKLLGVLTQPFYEKYFFNFQICWKADMDNIIENYQYSKIILLGLNASKSFMIYQHQNFKIYRSFNKWQFIIKLKICQ